MKTRDLKAAADHLTDSGFKAWTLLALNQNGYRWNGELSHSVASELERWGYLVPLDDGNNVFCPSGDVEGEAPGYPAAWTAIAELYGVPESEYSRIANRLKDYHLLEKVDSILSYWAGAYDDLQTSVDHSKSQIPLMFDLSVVLVWWIRDHFSFKVGDVIATGKDGGKLHFHDVECKDKILRALKESNTDRFTVTEKTLPFWAGALRNGGFELSPAAVGDILRFRREPGKSAKIR